MEKCYECRDYKTGVKTRKAKFLSRAFLTEKIKLCDDCYYYFKINTKTLRP